MNATPCLKMIFFLSITLLAGMPASLSAQTKFTEQCQVRSGTAYGKTFEDVVAKEGAAIAESCRYLTSPGWILGIIAGVKSSSAQRMHESNYQNICDTAGSDARKLVYCGYIHRSQWQATCCATTL